MFESLCCLIFLNFESDLILSDSFFARILAKEFTKRRNTELKLIIVLIRIVRHNLKSLG